jgi:phosphatidylserine/phosphatidylglycerophosphate/cardiolipin synthase-like enzyme
MSAFGLCVGCSGGSPVEPAADGGPLSSDGGAVDDGGSTADGGAPQTACTPYVPRTTVPDLLIGYDGLEAALLAQVNSAQSTLDVLMYELSTTSFLNAFIAAKQRGVPVRVLLDPTVTGNATARQRLTGAGIEVRDTPSTFTYSHSKMLIIDRAVAVIMSANLNDYSMRSERNYGVVDRDPEDVADALSVFETDWSGTGAPDLACTRLLVSPVNSRPRLFDLLSKAQHTIDFSVMYLTDTSLRELIKARAASGVQVRAMLADPCWITDNPTTFADLTAQGIPVKYMTQVELHAKLVIADGIVFVGSENLSRNSLDFNREVGVFVTESGPAAAAAAQFESDWAAGVTTVGACH